MSRKIKGYCSVFGGFLIHLTLGTFYTIGNMNTYITSYLRKHGQTDITYSTAIWINTAAVTGMGIIMFFAGILDRRVGTSITCAIGCVIFSASTALTYFSVQSNFLLVVITYGFIPALGSGIAYTAPIVNAIKWFPNNKGIVTGITVAGFGLGALVFDQVQTLYLNPQNYSPKDDDSIYFLKDSILSKVPPVFLILSLIYGVIQLIGVAFIFDAEKHVSKNELNDSMENISEVSERHSDITPRNVLKLSNFYILWIMFALGNQTIQFINTLYKSFGIDMKYDDHYLALVGSLGSLCNAVGRIFWGKLMDKYNFKDCVIILFAILSVLMFTLIMTSIFGRVFFMIWILMLFFTFSGITSLFPAVVAQKYGPTHANSIYGILYTASAVSSVLGSVMVPIILSELGWFSCFVIVGFMSVIGMATTMIFYK